MSLISQLGIDPDDLEWHDVALCNGWGPLSPDQDVFFDKYESEVETAKQTDEMCLHCPVMKQCAQEGLNGEIGVWGGIYWDGTGSPDKIRNAHKTDEVWRRIRERLA